MRTTVCRWRSGWGFRWREDGELPLPVDVLVGNPVEGAGFREFRIQTVRDCLTEPEVVSFTGTFDPFDGEMGERYFGIYGMEDDVTLEHGPGDFRGCAGAGAETGDGGGVRGEGGGDSKSQILNFNFA